MRELERQQLANGIVLTYSDDSKKVGDDRWMVRLLCVAELPLTGWMQAELAGDRPEDIFVRTKLAGRLAHEIFMERIFVADQEKEVVLDHLQGRIKENIVSYLAKEDFVRKLFLKRITALRELSLLQAVEEVAAVDGDDDGEPADFSACFK